MFATMFKKWVASRLLHYPVDTADLLKLRDYVEDQLQGAGNTEEYQVLVALSALLTVLYLSVSRGSGRLVVFKR